MLAEGGFATKYAANPGRWEKLESPARARADSDVRRNAAARPAAARLFVFRLSRPVSLRIGELDFNAVGIEILDQFAAFVHLA